MDDDDPVLSECKVCVAFPAELVLALLQVLLVVVVPRQADRAHMTPSSAVPEHDLQKSCKHRWQVVKNVVINVTLFWSAAQRKLLSRSSVR